MNTRFNIDGMSCEHCKKRVEKAIAGVEGVNSVVVSLEDGAATVDYARSEGIEARIIEAVEQAGYDVV